MIGCHVPPGHSLTLTCWFAKPRCKPEFAWNNIMRDDLTEKERALLPVTFTEGLSKLSVERPSTLLDSRKSGEDDATSSPALPARAASPAEVRAYIKELLITKHDLTQEYAEVISSKWKVLRGWSLRGMTRDQFIEYFGEDIGPHFTGTFGKISGLLPMPN